MGFRIVYKDGNSKTCGFTEATRLIAEEGYSWTKDVTAKLTPAKKTAKLKKAKVKVEAEVKMESPFNDGNPVNIDLGSIKGD